MTTTPSQTPSNAVWTVPNVLTFLRLALLPVFLWVSLDLKQLWWAVALGVFGTVTDLADGAIARRSGTITKLGILLDPLSDRLSLAAGVLVILVHDLAWPPLVWAVVTRDALLVIAGSIMLKVLHRSVPPVTWLGKRASFTVSVGLGSFILAGAVGSIAEPNEPIRIAATVITTIGFVGYVASAIGYVRTALRAPANPT